MTDQFNLHMTIDAPPICLSREIIGRTANMQWTSVQALCKPFTYKRASNTMAVYKTVAIVLHCSWEKSSKVRFSSYVLLRGYKKKKKNTNSVHDAKEKNTDRTHWTLDWTTDKLKTKNITAEFNLVNRGQKHECLHTSWYHSHILKR